MEGKPQSADKVGEENHPFMRFGVGTTCPAAGSRCAISAAKYPAPCNFLMCPSVMEEAIHLPPAPDMFWRELRRKMQTWALELECARMDEQGGRRRG